MRATDPFTLLHCDRGPDVSGAFVVLDDEVVDVVVGDALRLARELQCRIRKRLVFELLVDLIEVIVVDVPVTERHHQLTRLEVGLLSDHHRQQCIAGDVEGHTQEHVGTTLVQVA